MKQGKTARRRIHASGHPSSDKNECRSDGWRQRRLRLFQARGERGRARICKAVNQGFGLNFIENGLKLCGPARFLFMRPGKEEKWIPVGSSAVRRVRYHNRKRTLDLIYSDGDPYEYFNVPRSKFRALMRAASKGKFVNKEIKPKHPFRKL